MNFVENIVDLKLNGLIFPENENCYEISLKFKSFSSVSYGIHGAGNNSAFITLNWHSWWDSEKYSKGTLFYML